MRVEIAVGEAFVLGESPFWDEDGAALWWVDIRAPAIHRWSPASGARSTWPMPALVGSIVPRSAGGLVAGLHSGFHFFAPATGALELVARPEADLPKNRPNDARCDRAGRYWCGTMEDYGANRRGTLYRMDPDRTLHAVDGPFVVPNSLAFSADGMRMHFADTRQGDILRYPYDGASGVRGAASVLLPGGAAPGHPDGSCVDADGCLWNARYGGSAVVRVTPAGRVDRIVALPVSQPTSCAFGGARLDELYVTTARQRLDAAQLAAEPAAGCVLVLRPGVSGLPEARYAG
jgi:sugar lactone lactonase YvrE